MDNPSWLIKRLGRYNLGEMAVVFSIGSVLVGLVLVLVWILLSSLHLALASDIIGSVCAVIWATFILWLWEVLVIVGKMERATRTSDHDMRAMSVLFFIVVCFNILFDPSAVKTEWHTVSLIFEWIIVMFHIIYFLLALCIWVRVPWVIWFRSAVNLLVVLWQTSSGHGV